LYDSERRGSDPEQNAERYRNEQSYCVSRCNLAQRVVT